MLKEKNDLEQEVFRRRLEAAQIESARDLERREAAAAQQALTEEAATLRRELNAAREEAVKNATEKEEKLRRVMAKRMDDEETMEALR